MIDDLKHFIETTLSNYLKIELEPLEARLTAKIDSMSANIAQAMDVTNDDHQSQFSNHERRIRRLEGRSI